MEVITLLTLFSLLSLVRCAPLSTLLTCSIVHRGPLFLVWNGAHSPPQAPRQLVDIDHKGRLYISSERLCESTVRFVYEKCQNEGGETGVGCALGRPKLKRRVTALLIAAPTVSPNYAGFPAAASFGNSMVSLYTGRLKLAGQRDRCVSSQAREHGSGADVRLSKCLEAWVIVVAHRQCSAR